MSLCDLIARELEADQFQDDITTHLLRLGDRTVQSKIFSREKGIFCGESIISAFQKLFSSTLHFNRQKANGDPLSDEDCVLVVEGSASVCLSIERTLLNLLSHVSGIASRTRQFVDAALPFPTQILATRKTLPGLRSVQLEGVKAGGGFIHRRSLSDGVLIKENHQTFVPRLALLERARKETSPLHRAEIEVQKLSQLREILEELPEIVMLDNLTPQEISEAIQLIGGRCRIEASGGITLEKIKSIAALGVDYISVGELTHSVRAHNFSMEYFPEGVRLV